jgi:excisionase family DNA binding protein
MEKSVSTCTSAKKLLTVKQVADRLSISVHTVYKWAESGRLPAVKLGYMLRFDPDRIEKFITRGETP